MTEKTEDLIAEARQEEEFARANRYGQRSHAELIVRLADALEARQPSENDREALAKQLRDIGAVRKVDQDCSCQDCEGAAEWVNAPLSVVLDHFKTNVSDAEPTHLVCAWCPQPARGDAWHNDGKLHPSCGQIAHGQGWVPPYTPRAAVPDAATEIERYRDAAEGNRIRLVHAQNDAEQFEVERDAALAAVERVRAAKLEVDSVHQIHGTECLCGFSSARSRSRTEHITEAILAALDGAPEPEEKR